MSENYNDDEIIDSSEDTEKKRNKSEKFCFLCRRPESKQTENIILSFTEAFQ